MSPPRRTDSTATPSPPTRRSRTGRSLSRRTFIAAGGATALVSMAGCTAVMDFLGDFALQEVNVFNGADTPVNGTIEIVDQNDDVVLEEPFDLAAEADDDEENADADSTALYEDVWTDAGDYEVSIELEGDSFDTELDASEAFQNDSNDTETGEESATDSNDTGTETNRTSKNDSNDTGPGIETESVNGSSDTGTVTIFDTEMVTIDDPEEEHLVVGLAQEGSAELISFHVIENFSDLEDEFE